MIEVRALRHEELRYWFDFAARASGQARSHFVQRWEGDPHPFLEGIRVAADGDRIVSTLRIFDREIHLGGLTVSIGGVGVVCTDEQYRGQGLPEMLLNDAIRFMAQRDMAVSILFDSFYEPYLHGWKPVAMAMGLSHLMVNADGGPYQSTAANPRDPAEARQMQMIYAVAARSLQGSVVRSDLAYWTGWIPNVWKRSLVARRDGRLVGYMAADWLSPDQLRVEDFAALPGEVTPVFEALVRALARERSLEMVRVAYPLALRPDLKVAERPADAVAMYRVIKPPLLPLKSAQVLDRLLQGESADHLIWQTDWF